jgi:ABC-type cobalamin transport system permease subunit
MAASSQVATVLNSHAWVDPQLAPALVVVIVLAAVGTAVLFLASLVAYSRRRTSRYLLIAVALGLLVGRSMVGLGTVFGLVPMTIHHLVEHGFDFLIAVVVLYAVYRSGPTDETTLREPGHE